MADRFPLIVDSATGTVKELPSGDNLNLSGSNIINTTSIGVTSINVTGVTTTSSLIANTVDITPIHDILVIQVATSGNDATGTGTTANPFKTPHKALSFLKSKRISTTPGYARVTINVGVGTYNFGLNQTAAGSNYISGTYPISGGTGSGAFVAITTTTGGAILGAKLADPGLNYLVTDTLGINTTTGSGAAFTIFHTGVEGEILGPLFIDHLDGDQINLNGGAVTGIRPGRRGNHFYNQVGVGVGSTPSGTGPNHTWSQVYDATSPVGAYPNPMVNGRGNTDASNVYNKTILQAHYSTELYFYGCDGIVSLTQNPVKISDLLLIGLKPNGSRIIGAGDNPATQGLANQSVIGISTEAGGEISIGIARAGVIDAERISVHGFTYGLYMVGGYYKSRSTTVTNQSVGLILNHQSYTEISFCHSLNHESHAVYSYGGHYYVYGGSFSNCGTTGVFNQYNGFGFVGNQNIDTVGFGNSTIIANNGSNGVLAFAGGCMRCDGSYSNKQFVYGNGSSQMLSQNGGIIEASNATGNLVVEAASGSSTTFSPAVNVIGNNNAIINQ